MTELLRAEGLCKRYRLPDGRKLPALDGLSLTLAQGEWLGVIGASGAGKSTLCRVLLGLLTPDAGTLFLEGVPVKHRRDRIRLRGMSGMVFQHPAEAMNPVMRVWEVIAEPLEVAGVSRAQRMARAEELLAQVGLEVRLHGRYASELSGGQQQRVCVARALVNRPRLLVCDEPTAALDLSAAAQLLNLLADLREQGLGGVFLSHDVEAVRWLCTRTLVLDGGCAVECGPTEALFARPTHPCTRALLGR